MNNLLLILPDGTRHKNISVDEVRQILIDECHWSYARVKSMIDKLVSHDEETQWLLRANNLCDRIENTTAHIRQVSRKMDEEFQQWLLSKKSTSA